jgi:hypothetical protein
VVVRSEQVATTADGLHMRLYCDVSERRHSISLDFEAISRELCAITASPIPSCAAGAAGAAKRPQMLCRSFHDDDRPSL